MPISVTCPHCSLVNSFPDDAAGRQVACPRCKYQFKASAAPPGSNAPIPSVGQPAPPQPSAPSPRAVMRAASSSDVRGEPVRVVVVDLEMPFFSLVWLLVKIALAAIPAAFILYIIFGGSFLLMLKLAGM